MFALLIEVSLHEKANINNEDNNDEDNDLNSPLLQSAPNDHEDHTKYDQDKECVGSKLNNFSGLILFVSLLTISF